MSRFSYTVITFNKAITFLSCLFVSIACNFLSIAYSVLYHCLSLLLWEIYCCVLFSAYKQLEGSNFVWTHTVEQLDTFVISVR